MNVIEVDVGKAKIFSIGQQYNNNALVIHFVNLPNRKNKYIYYKIDDIEEEIPLVSDLFIVSRPLMMHSGEVKAQIITRDENNSIIELTNNFTMRIKPSNYSGIGEDESYPDDPNIKNYFVKIDEKVNSFEELANLVQTKLDNGDFVGAQGPKGEKGDPGDVTEEYRNLANQIAQNASDAQAGATNAQTSASNAQKILDDTKTFANQAISEVNQIKTDTSALKDEANASAVNAQKILDDAKAFANQTKSELNQIKTDTSGLKDEANTSALNAKASETKAKEYADNLQASTDDISQLKEDLNDYKNGFEYMPIIDGQYVNASTGAFAKDDNWSRTDYIDCSKFSMLVFENNTKISIYNAFYDDNKEFISNLRLMEIGKNIIEVPKNAKYFVLSNTTLNLNNIMLKSKLNLDIETIFSEIGNATDIKFVFEDGYYIDDRTGEKKADSSWKCSNKIELPSNAKRLIISFYGQKTNNQYNAFYDSDNNRIGKINILANTDNQCFIVPNNAKYFSFSLVKNATISVKSDLLKFKELNNSQEDYDNDKFIIQRNSLNTTIHSISRMGFSDGGYPKESINAFKEAIKMGFDVIRCNYRITSDGVPVSLHDSNINSKNARMKNGTTITNPVDVDTLTFDAINETYNFSTSGSVIYPITKFEDVVKLCKQTGTTLYVEMKIIPTNAQCDTLIAIIKKYGMEKNVQFIGFNSAQESVNAIKYIVENSNVLRVGIMLDYFDDSVIQRVGTIKSSNVSVFIWGWDTMELTGYIDTLISNGIEYEMGTVDTKERIVSYFDNDDNNYCIGVESNSIVASKVIIESVIN